MIFEKLTVCDFGVFKGAQEFDLAPRNKGGSRHPIVLFGGLNGSGKTSLLTAIRLALHGRQSLGYGTSQKKYDALLSRLFHREPAPLMVANETWVKLDFSYSIYGEMSRYSVERRWQLTGNGISERFTLSENDVIAESVDPEQAQAFLTQLVPLGVADLFFFDGEKIADLASEDDGGILTESIKQLFGLDVVSKLRSDLDIYDKKKLKAAEDQNSSSKGLSILFDEIEENDNKVDAKYKLIREKIDPEITTIRVDLDRLEGRMSEIDGVWAMSRTSFKKKHDDILEKKKLLEAKLREIASGVLPLALAPSLASDVLYQLEVERENNQQTLVSKALKGKRKILRERLKAVGITNDVDQILQVITNLLEENHSVAISPIHQLGEADRERVVSDLAQIVPFAVRAAQTIRVDLGQIDIELESLSIRLSAAPSDEQLQADLQTIKRMNQDLGELTSKKRTMLVEIKELLSKQIQLVRTVKKNSSNDVSLIEGRQTTQRLSSIKNSLDLFSEKLAAQKTNLLAENFIQSFRKLSRKNSLVAAVEVNPNTLALKLMGTHGEEVLKSQLSAGERQMFAIAMLDALAKTSGRSIPIIIDTPLGRLDSQHRHNFVNNYLPFASHQVIVLSTDTEVDQDFYNGLEAFISHAYHLAFNENSRATIASEEYFWHHLSPRVQNAA